MDYGVLVLMLFLWLSCSTTAQILLKSASSGVKVQLILIAVASFLYLLSMFVQYLAYLFGIPASTFVPLFNCNQIVLAFYARTYLHEPISLVKWFAILLILTGCLFIGFGSKL